MIASPRVILVVLLLVPPSARAAWDKPFYDPVPADDDLILPLPCGGAMAFRPVEVPLGPGPLEDRPIELGQAGTEEGYIEFTRNSFIAAPFTAAGGARRYWIGKYNVTRDQFAAMQQKCAPPTPTGRIAATGMSWFDAVAASAAWSSWLLTNARDRLPHRKEAYGFVRLPTEDEWEFAARGGVKVDAEGFLAPLWPAPEGIEHYAASGAARNDGHPPQIGRNKLPNPLGIYDLLGDVDQMMIEPFRLNHVGRAHGQAGGIAARGGNFTMEPERLHTAMRTEVPPFDARTGAPARLSTLGFRLVISAPTLATLEEAESARTAFAKQVSSRGDVETDARAALAALRAQTADAVLQRALDHISATISVNEREHADQAKIVVKSQIDAAVLMAQAAWMLNHIAETQAQFAASLGKADADAMRQAAERRRASARGYVDPYLTLIRQIAASPYREAQLSVEREELSQRRRQSELKLLPLVASHSEAPSPPDAERAWADITELSTLN